MIYNFRHDKERTDDVSARRVMIISGVWDE